MPPIKEEHIKIGLDRHVSVPEALRAVSVQYDHNIETVTFDCPRFWDGHDMSKMTVYINYMRQDRHRDKDLAENVTVDQSDENIMHFTWTLSRNATLCKGELKFLACVVDVDDQGFEKHHWNSKLCENQLYINEGLECEDAVKSMHADIITDLLLRMDKIVIADAPILDMTLTEKGLAADASVVGTRLAAIDDSIKTSEENLRSEITNEATTRKTEIAVERARINAFTALKQGSTTGDAELIDARIGKNGEKFDTAGAAIREQLSRVEDRMDSLLKGIIDPCGRNVITSTFVQGVSIDIYTGTETPSTDEYHTSVDYMYVNPSEPHYVIFDKETRTYMYFYDSDKTYITNIFFNVSGELPAFPENAVYVKVVFIRNSETDNPFERDIRIMEGVNKSGSELIIPRNVVSEDNCTFFVKDLLNRDEIEYGMVFHPGNGVPYETDMERAVTGFIDVRNVSHITTNFRFYIAYYDYFYKFIPDIKDENSHAAGTYPIPEGAVYIRLILLTLDPSVVAGYHLSNCEEAFDTDGVLKLSALPSYFTEKWYKGKKISVLGDSITEGDKWQKYVAAKLGCTMVSCGIGGTTVANNGNVRTYNGVEIESWMCSDDRINLIPQDSDMIILFGGANDWAQSSIDMGELGDGNLIDTTFKSAYSLMIKKIVNKFPNARIVGMTPINGRTSVENANEDKQFSVRGLTIYDFALAVKEVCMYYGIPCIDVHGESGINTFNHTTYIQDVVHPNEYGGKRIANAVVNGLKRFEPIDF